MFEVPEYFRQKVYALYIRNIQVPPNKSCMRQIFARMVQASKNWERKMGHDKVFVH